MLSHKQHSSDEFKVSFVQIRSRPFNYDWRQFMEHVKGSNENRKYERQNPKNTKKFKKYIFNTHGCTEAMKKWSK